MGQLLQGEMEEDGLERAWLILASGAAMTSMSSLSDLAAEHASSGAAARDGAHTACLIIYVYVDHEIDMAPARSVKSM